jgi:hypothetical protein
MEEMEPSRLPEKLGEKFGTSVGDLEDHESRRRRTKTIGREE